MYSSRLFLMELCMLVSRMAEEVSERINTRAETIPTGSPSRFKLSWCLRISRPTKALVSSMIHKKRLSACCDSASATCIRSESKLNGLSCS